MKAIFKPNDKLSFEVEAENLQEVMKTLGPIQEVLGSCRCGKCGGNDIRFLHRKVDKYDYYELVCQTPRRSQAESGSGLVYSKDIPCGHKLALGNDGTNLFPRRYEQDPNDKKKPLLDKDGNKVWLPNNGWVRWDGSKYV